MAFGTFHPPSPLKLPRRSAAQPVESGSLVVRWPYTEVVMSSESLDEKFQRISKLIESKVTRPPMNLSTKLELYGLWNQAVHGPVSTPKPSRMKIVAHAKWSAHKRYEHLSTEEAKKRFLLIAEGALAMSKL
ncbi:putative Acyl CoA binding protein [Trypanosoma vivax]|uniref:Putative acyl-CoA binding protein n=1 Tax=Trypanosoma vivax (strain Y486) TaxID=1055687 RepID=G0TU81_TRYVY|nr:putative acyl-CoA binding protein [Trypanosoma vivax]KAH8613596.1 putative Acyl CoA binding protein [Trypanosoma vivax]CCC47515.1 putative acyl-CoA binding protein [Trypanosoma vivax Y486]